MIPSTEDAEGGRGFVSGIVWERCRSMDMKGLGHGPTTANMAMVTKETTITQTAGRLILERTVHGPQALIPTPISRAGALKTGTLSRSCNRLLGPRAYLGPRRLLLATLVLLLLHTTSYTMTLTPFPA